MIIRGIAGGAQRIWDQVPVFLDCPLHLPRASAIKPSPTAYKLSSQDVGAMPKKTPFLARRKGEGWPHEQNRNDNRSCDSGSAATQCREVRSFLKGLQSIHE